MQESHLIAFYSKQLKGNALMPSTYERELLALVSAISKWKPYLLGHTFNINTDQQTLKYLLEQKIATKAQQGKANKVADALSQQLEEDEATLAIISFPTTDQINEQKLSYNASPDVKQLVDLLQQ